MTGKVVFPVWDGRFLSNQWGGRENQRRGKSLGIPLTKTTLSLVAPWLCLTKLRRCLISQSSIRRAFGAGLQ